MQAKLLRVLEAREVMPLGAAKAIGVDFALCCATNRDLRALAATRALREDLFFRIATPSVTLPPLRERPEEIPALVEHELGHREPPQAPHVSLVEQCLLRPWPGNVRELLAEVRAAAQAVAGDASAAGRVSAHHLAPAAGSAFAAVAHVPPAVPRSSAPAVGFGGPDGRERIVEALRAHGGNVAATARALGLHRTQLRRWIERHDLGNAGNASDDDAPE